MSWVTVIWSMTATACLTLAMIHGFIWWQNRTSWPNLAFMCTAIGAAAFAACEFAMMKAQNERDYAELLRWAHVPVLLIVVSLTVFVKLYCRAGRLWLIWSVCGLRAISLILDITTGATLNYRRITHVRHVDLFGDSIATADGILNPWMIVGQASLFLLMVFVADAAATVWRRGERRLALFVGGSILFFAIGGTAQSMWVFWGHAQWPITASLFYLGIVVAMSYELGNEALSAARLARELRSSQQIVTDLLRAASLGELSSAIAHELNQPLTAIMSNAQAAQRLLSRETTDLQEIRDILTDIVSDDRRASEVINRLRKLLKKGDLHRQTLDANAVIQEVVRLLTVDLRSRHISIATELGVDLPMIFGDPVQLQQVLINLMLNASDAMAHRSIRMLTINAAVDTEESVRISVIDTGVGIPDGDAEKIFEPYHTTKTNGLGLGLSLSRSIIHSHGGKLWAENQPDGGTAFAFTLPAAKRGTL